MSENGGSVTIYHGPWGPRQIWQPERRADPGIVLLSLGIDQG